MNLLHLKYCVEIARAGSINKAADTLLIAQPNLSRSVKELEAELGITIFERTARGVFLTPDGEEFIGHANAILSQVDDVENMYKHSLPIKRRFSVSVPRATYIADAFAHFSRGIPNGTVEIFYKETNSSRTIKNLLYDDYKLGIVRYAENYEMYFQSMFANKGFAYEQVSEFRYVLIMRADSPLASLPEIHYADLEPLIEIAHADPYVPSLSAAQVKKEELPDNVKRRIFVFERASQFDLLAENPETFMWVSPTPQTTLDRYGLVQRECRDNTRVYQDVLIYKKDYSLTELDQNFIAELGRAKQKYL